MKTLFVIAAALISFAAPAAADNGDADFISYLQRHNLGCSEGVIKCKSDAELIGMGHAVCYDIDKNGHTLIEAADTLFDIGGGSLNRQQADTLVAAAVVNYCPSDETH
jgi:hypothetical protein